MFPTIDTETTRNTYRQRKFPDPVLSDVEISKRGTLGKSSRERRQLIMRKCESAGSPWTSKHQLPRPSKQHIQGRLYQECPYRSNSSFIISTISSGNFWIFFLLKSIVRPGLRVLLTPLASAAFASFSWAARIASLARAIT